MALGRVAEHARKLFKRKKIQKPSKPLSSADDSKLLSLPSELRNEIWALALTESMNGPIDLLDAKLPDDALLRVNRQVRSEVKGFYEAACKQYWIHGHFHLKIPKAAGNDRKVLKEIISRPSPAIDENIKLISDLTVQIEGDGIPDLTFCFESSLWVQYWHYKGWRPEHNVFVPSKRAKSSATVKKLMGLELGLVEDSDPGTKCVDVKNYPRIEEIPGRSRWNGLTKYEIMWIVRWMQQLR